MTVKEMAAALELKPIAGESGMGNEIKGVYIGDLLSWVMGRAKEGDAWLTIQGHINIIAVGVLASVSCIIVCEDAEVAEATIAKAESEEIPLLTTSCSMYEVAVKLWKVQNEAVL